MQALLSLASLVLVPALAQEPASAPAVPRAESRADDPFPLAAVERGEPRPWEHETSDVPVNPRLRFGHLANGMRFVWLANGEPERRCYLRLHLDVGSLAEEPHERGMAHFLEHMVFNGTERFPGTTLIEWFQEQGMDFGGDTNASTGWSETIYEIDLPESDPATLKEGLAVLRDFADGALLDPAEIEAEKGVVDGEERERDSSRMRIWERTLDTALAGTRPPTRWPIGTAEARRGFDAESLRTFYDEWYRPELATLFVVGDLGELDPEPLLRAAFASWAVPESDPPREPALGTPTKEELVFCVFDDEVPEATVTLGRLVPWVDEAYDTSYFDEWVPLEYARRMINLRFSERSREEATPFLSAGVSEAGFGQRIFEGEELGLRCAPDRWRESLAFCEQELRRALEFGFQEAELDELRANALRALDEAIERERTRSSTSWLRELLAAAEYRLVPTTATTDRALLRPRVEALTVEDCQKALRKAWSEGDPTLYTAGGLDLGDDAAKTLRAAWEESRAVELEAPAEIEVAAFAYASSPEAAGAVAGRKHVEDLDVHQVRFANGVRLNLKRTDFRDQEILLRAVLGQGELTLSEGARALAPVADACLLQGGYGEHTIEEVRRLTAGKEVGWGFSVAPDAFLAGGSTTSEDLLLQCELFCAMRDLGWRDGGLQRYRRNLPQYFESLDHELGGPIQREYLELLHGGDERFGIVPQEELMAVDMEDLREWLAPHIASAPLEITLVGDLDVEETLAAAARTFGTLPERRAPQDYSERRQSPPITPGLRKEYTVDSETPKAVVYLSFPAPDGFDLGRRRELEFLVTVLRDRLRVGLREELGAAYSPAAAGSFSQLFPGLGELAIQVLADPGEAAAVSAACLAVTDELAKEGLDREELERLRAPAVAHARDARRRNGYWLHYLSESQAKPERLTELRTDLAFFDGLDPEAISKWAKELLVRERVSRAIVRPRAQGTEAAPREAAAPAEEGPGGAGPGGE